MIPLSPLYSSVKIWIIGSIEYAVDPPHRHNEKALDFDDVKKIILGIL